MRMMTGTTPKDPSPTSNTKLDNDNSEDDDKESYYEYSDSSDISDDELIIAKGLCNVHLDSRSPTRYRDDRKQRHSNSLGKCVTTNDKNLQSGGAVIINSTLLNIPVDSILSIQTLGSPDSKNISEIFNEDDNSCDSNNEWLKNAFEELKHQNGPLRNLDNDPELPRILDESSNLLQLADDNSLSETITSQNISQLYQPREHKNSYSTSSTPSYNESIDYSPISNPSSDDPGSWSSISSPSVQNWVSTTVYREKCACAAKQLQNICACASKQLQNICLCASKQLQDICECAKKPLPNQNEFAKQELRKYITNLAQGPDLKLDKWIVATKKSTQELIVEIQHLIQSNEHDSIFDLKMYVLVEVFLKNANRDDIYKVFKSNRPMRVQLVEKRCSTRLLRYIDEVMGNNGLSMDD